MFTATRIFTLRAPVYNMLTEIWPCANRAMVRNNYTMLTKIHADQNCVNRGFPVCYLVYALLLSIIFFITCFIFLSLWLIYITCTNSTFSMPIAHTVYYFFFTLLGLILLWLRNAYEQNPTIVPYTVHIFKNQVVNMILSVGVYY